MSDKMPYGREARDILFHNVLGLISRKQDNNLTEEQQTRLSSFKFSATEMILLEAYNKHYDSFLRCNLHLTRTHSHKRLNKYDKFIIDNAKAEIQHCKEVLALLEIKKEMQDILNRFCEPNEKICLSFAEEYFEKVKKEEQEQREAKKASILCIGIIVAIILSLFIYRNYISM
jgi:hypothetical protein